MGRKGDDGMEMDEPVQADITASHLLELLSNIYCKNDKDSVNKISIFSSKTSIQVN